MLVLKDVLSEYTFVNSGWGWVIWYLRYIFLNILATKIGASTMSKKYQDLPKSDIILICVDII